MSPSWLGTKRVRRVLALLGGALGLALVALVSAVWRKPLPPALARAPETSLVLTMPSAESPSDGHPNVTFTGPQDPDYIKILAWLREGAKLN